MLVKRTSTKTSLHDRRVTAVGRRAINRLCRRKTDNGRIFHLRRIEAEKADKPLERIAGCRIRLRPEI